jgi:hypothetical protein
VSITHLRDQVADQFGAGIVRIRDRQDESVRWVGRKAAIHFRRQRIMPELELQPVRILPRYVLSNGADVEPGKAAGWPVCQSRERPHGGDLLFEGAGKDLEPIDGKGVLVPWTRDETAAEHDGAPVSGCRSTCRPPT